ncbi:MAG: hypothetical protein AVDCRST_MAG93-5782 [uncultured Chloroflexia bacterium]|uniref:Uncharacterized protein n=1 Tax=uncultured Chloroflexia bacterium TaxID=1672391 RepID=A0A6J4L446_9CHLR|nr:MAG: hypothetical protein AVDCRST_MAG93-5782 [uncultured Chloroflexia bacterium]
MPLGLWWEGFGVALLGVITAVLLVRWLLRRRKQRFAAFVLASGLLLGLSAHTAWQLEQYCSQRHPHVDCVDDSYDGLLWKVYRPMRRVYLELRHTLF